MGTMHPMERITAFGNVNYNDAYSQSQEEFDKSILETIELNKENNAVESIEIY